MSKAIDRLIAYRTLRAIQETKSNERIGEMIAEVAEEEAAETRPAGPTRWERWKAAVERVERRLL